MFANHCSHRYTEHTILHTWLSALNFMKKFGIISQILQPFVTTDKICSSFGRAASWRRTTYIHERTSTNCSRNIKIGKNLLNSKFPNSNYLFYLVHFYFVLWKALVSHKKFIKYVILFSIIHVYIKNLINRIVYYIYNSILCISLKHSAI